MPMDAHEIRRIAQTWIEMHRLPEESQERDAKFWAFERLSDLVRGDPEEAWLVIEAIRRLDGSDLILVNVAAGPLEDLLVHYGDQFIDRFEVLAQDDRQFRKLLGAVWQNDMSDALWARLRQLLRRLGEARASSPGAVHHRSPLRSVRAACCQLSERMRCDCQQLG